VDPKQQQQQQEEQLQEKQLSANSTESEPLGCQSTTPMLQQKYKFLKHLGGGAFGAVVQASTGNLSFDRCWCDCAPAS
jgi:hypothetical protein